MGPWRQREAFGLVLMEGRAAGLGVAASVQWSEKSVFVLHFDLG